jgi:Type II secretory pathway, prepilin signal peptidase PulO and related peptidases
MIAVLVGAFGSLIGSFLNVVVYRVPAGRSIVSPPSACGSCGHAVRAYDNIPIVSWLVLRGRCRDCAAPISVRYPFVELGAAVAFGVVAWHFLPDVLAAGTVPATVAGVVQLVAYLYFTAIGIALALIDLDTRRLPNVLVLPSLVVGVALFGVAAALTGAWVALGTAVLGALALGAFYLVLALARPGGMGMGDVKLAALVGLFTGWLGLPALLVAAIGTAVLAGVVAVGMLLAGRGRRATIAFGPWLLAGAALGILAGEPIARGYLTLFGIG